jgi:heparosan-N-sulfate-glucuronate 5-epimerase
MLRFPQNNMADLKRLNYYRRLFAAYLVPGKSQLTFWHEPPVASPNFDPGKLGPYYMPFSAKADYPGHFDPSGIPMLDYRGVLGLQYNPIAIAQYGLGNFNLFLQTGDAGRRRKFLRASDWLVTNLEVNAAGLAVWHHHFDWEYRTTLTAPWYSGLAQGQGISLLVRAATEARDGAYLEAAQRAFVSLQKTVEQGGVLFEDEHGHVWIEEYVVSPPTHILNGFMWAMWGVYDYWLATGDSAAKRLFDRSMETLTAHLRDYDTGFWSLYEQSGTRMKMLASAFYHRLHITQLKVLWRLTGDEVFARFAEKWEGYTRSGFNRRRALVQKSVFKLLYY